MSMSEKHITEIKKRNGTIRDSRMKAALLENPFLIDDRSPWDILAYIASFLEKINFYTTEDRVEGNWKKLVEKDSLIFMASIINEPTDDLDDLIRNYDAGKVQSEPEKKEEIIDLLLHWWMIITDWADRLSDINEKNLSVKIRNSLVNSITFNRDYIVIGEDGKPNIANLKSAAQQSSTSGIELDKILHDFQKAISHIKEATKSHFESDFLTSDKHLPHNAMYITFALLYLKISDRLNKMSQHHLDFYYKDVLQQKTKNGTDSRAIVNFDLQPMVTSSLVPKGTKLSAGKIMGSKTEILFEITKDLWAHQAELVNIQTLYINSNPYIDIGTTDPIISSVTYNRLYAYSEDQIPRNKWFVFGANKKSVQDSEIKEYKTAKIGFIIGSPVLFLKEGRREIKLRFNLDKATSDKYFWKLLEEIRCAKNIALSTAVSMVFDKGFKISYTNVDGWIPCDSYQIEYNDDPVENYFSIKLLLDITHPSLDQGMEIPETLKWPSIKIELNEYAPIFGYSFFKQVELNTIDIEVAVSEIKDLTFYNNIGKMPTAKPFELFGPQPKKGDYLMIGCSEIFKKQVMSLDVNLDWETVPKDYGGFESYYGQYSETFNNDSFQVQFSALSGGYWYPGASGNNPEIPLFKFQKCYTPQGYESTLLDSSRQLKFSNFFDLGLTNDQSLVDPLKYNVNSDGGFIKLTFSSPESGFGDRIYVKDYTEVATYNALNKRQISYPNKPFVPKIKGASLSYKANDVLSFVERVNAGSNSNLYNGEFKHITPYIVEDVIVDQLVKKHTLLPNFTQEGYLIMGLQGVKSRTDITLYFNFLRSSTTIDIEDNTLIWEYFSLPEWKKFDPSAIIRDDTEGFLKSGIVHMTIPHVDPEDRGIEPSILWIRASTIDDVENYPKIKGIYLNAVEAVCTSEDPTIIGQKIEAGTIDKLDGKLPDIKLVNQADESFYGTIPETRDSFYTRVSERLRHKGRAVTLWDYERLILEKFDDVNIVKCTSFNENFEPIAGHVKVVVLSTRWSKLDPYYFSKTKLLKMKNFLNRISSSFIDIEVINPLVEYLLVNCRVVLNKIDQGLNYRQILSEDISEFLSPISNMDLNNGGIGGSVMPSSVSNYIENLPYVNRLIELNIEHLVRHGMNDFTLDVHEKEVVLSAQTPWSILAPARDHRIYIEDEREDQIENNLDVGISTIGVGVDLIIGEHEEH